MTVNVGVMGAGAWGTALAQLLAEKGHEVTLWAFEPEVAFEIEHIHQNRTFLPDIALSPRVHATHELAKCLPGKDLILSVVPSHVARAVLREAIPYLPEGVPIVSASKGIENGTLMTMSEVMEDELPLIYHPMLTFLSGPTFAREVALRHPTAATVAGRFERVAKRVQECLSGPFFRVYTSTDVTGVELGGSLKNVIAIAAGAATGLGFGTNTTTSLITRGLNEIIRLALHKGGNPLTMAGLSGMGDLVLTCLGQLSRNRQVGEKLGQGMKLKDIIGDMRQVAEGIRTAKSVYDLSRREGVEMPICDLVYRVLYEDLPAREAVSLLMERTLKRELTFA